MAQTVDMGGDTLVVGSIVTGVSTSGSGQIGNPNLNGMEIGGVLFGYQTANYLPTSTTAMTTAQAVFNVSTNGAVTVSGNQTYMFEGMYTITCATTAAHVYQLGFGGNATVASIGYQVYCTPNSTATQVSTAANCLYVSTTALTNIAPSQTSSVEVTNIFLNGIVSFNGGGTFIPQFAMSTPATVPTTSITISKGSYIGLWPVGNATTKTVGSWS